MYVTRLDLTLPTTRAVEFQRQNDRRSELLREQPGFRTSLLLNSLGYPVMQMSPMYFQTTKFVLLTEWESEQAAVACFDRADWREFAAEHRSEALFEPQEPAQPYEPLEQFGKVVDRAPFAWLVGFEVDATRERVVGLEGELRELLQGYHEELRPFVEGRLLRDAAAPDRLLLVLLLTGQTEFPPGEGIADLEPLRGGLFPDADIGGRAIPEGFQVVSLVRAA